MHDRPPDTPRSGYPARVEGFEVGFFINWVSVAVFLVLATAIAFFAKYVSGGWTRPWLGIKPMWWFVVLFLLPQVGLPLLAVSMFLHRRNPGAITGRRAAA
jgi:hypothetical protein